MSFFGIAEFRSFRSDRILLASLLFLIAYCLPQFAIESAYGQRFGTRDSDAGYLDSAFITDKLRVRFDAGWDLNRPDRAEFFYATWANLADHPHAIKDTNQLLSAVNDRGPFLLPEHVNFQEISTYLELACNDHWSVFAELPIRFVQFKGDIENPEAFTTPAFRARYDLSATETDGVSDTIVGFKYGVFSDPDQALTFQFRTFIPTGDSRNGLGTGHVSVEPGMLMQTRLSNGLSLMGQAKLWTPIDGGANAGNVAIYGAGVGFDLYQGCGYSQSFCIRNLRITPLAEFVGWTVLDGFETLSSPVGAEVVPNSAQVPYVGSDINANGVRQDVVNPTGGPIKDAPTSHGVRIARGATIINAKLGFRTHFNPQDSVYIGWGRALTGSRWYQDFARLEFRRLF